MSVLGFVFRSHPHSTSQGREGVDAILATSAFSEDIRIFFIGDGVTQLQCGQDPSAIHSRHYSPAFKLFELYDIEQIYVCQRSLQEQGLTLSQLILDGVQVMEPEALSEQLHHCDKILTF